jgi:hypothetical protein
MSTDIRNSLASFVTTYMVGEFISVDAIPLTFLDRKKKRRS